MIVEINDRIKHIINDMPFNITVKRNALKIYAALYLLSKRKNKWGYFSVSSEYLTSINKRYSRIIQHFQEVNLIEPYTRPKVDEKDIFKTNNIKYYDTSKGICMKYRFLISTDGETIDVDLKTNKHLRWYDIIEKSLLSEGWTDIRIKRDTYGRRVHHPAIKNYKEDFIGKWVIDAVSSQPRILYKDLKERGIVDVEYNKIFESDKDFYREIEYILELENREEAKDLFLHWINGKGYVPNYKIHLLFPVVSKYIKSKKVGNYKDMGSYLQRQESKIWIDDILNNIPVSWALPVHDSIIIKPEEVEGAISWLKSRYPDIRFKASELKNKK